MGNTPASPDRSSFPGSSLLDQNLCGYVEDTEQDSEDESSGKPTFDNLLQRADQFCTSSPTNQDGGREPVVQEAPPARRSSPSNPTSALLARALVSEVTDNPRTMTPAAMTEREKRLLRAQEAATRASSGANASSKQPNGPRPVGAPGGIGQASILGSLAHAFAGDESLVGSVVSKPDTTSVLPPNSLQENRANVTGRTVEGGSQHRVTIGLSLSRRHSTVGHPDTVTRQTAFDFNELQDRQYKYVSSTDSSGWRAGGGERGGPATDDMDDDDSSRLAMQLNGKNGTNAQQQQSNHHHKVAAPDTVHIPIIHIDAESPQAVDAIISALARGEIFIPHMSVLPEALSVNGISPPDLVVRFGCERNDDVPPDEWPNWCLEFMHNQLYEYFCGMGARWNKRPFSITLAKKVRWKTVKHMNRYFAHAERVLDAWREKGPQYLDPQLSYIEGGATPEEVARPHGIYLLRNGVPTNYFAPNFDPPYTTKMTRSLLLNVLGKSWDKKRREWTSEPIPRLVTPSMLMATMCGCTDTTQGGFMANEVTMVDPDGIPGMANLHSGPDVMRKLARKGADSTAMRMMEGADETLHEPKKQETATRRPETTTSFPDVEEEKKSSSEVILDDNFEREFDDKVNVRNKKAEKPMTTRTVDTMPSDECFSPMNAGKITPSHFLTNGEEPLPVVSPKDHSAFSFSENKDPEPFLVDPPTIANSARDGFPSTPAPKVEETEDPVLSARMPSPETVELREMTGSVAASHSTVMHTNLSSRLVSKELGRKRGEEPDGASITSDGCESKENNSPAKGSRSSPRKRMGRRERLERERNIAMVVNAEQEETTRNPSQTMISPKNKDAVQRLITAERNRAALNKIDQFSWRKSLPNGVQRNDSGVSLEYSVDSSMMADQSTMASSIMGYSTASAASASTLLGQHFAGDGSVTSASASRQKSPRLSSRHEEDEASAALSLPESNSSLEPVPTDEELFSVGWAKALDPKSGSYYYFTLDRSKIVWENPLAPNRLVSGESADSSIPPGAAAI